MTGQDAESLTEWRGTKKIVASGNSMAVNLTEACRMMGLERGELVEIVVRKL